MVLLLLSLPLIISFLIGYCLIRLLLGKDGKIDSWLLSFLALGLGLGISASIAFFSFLLFNEFNRSFIIGGNLVLLLSLLIKEFYFDRRKIDLRSLKPLSSFNLIFLIIFVVAVYYLWQYAMIYPYGGWDAWQVWNLKARFLFLGGENWKNMLEPALWRTSPHYPLLLPLINVWTWSFLPVPVELGPLVISILFTILTAGVLTAGLKTFIPEKIALLAPLVFLTLPFYILIAISQYTDIPLAYFLLAGIICLIQAQNLNQRSFAVLAGLFLGFLSFTKPEGMIASLILIFLAFPFFLRGNKDAKTRSLLKNFLLAVCVAFIPTALFHLIYSPGNQTFINGLISTEHAADMNRLKFIFVYFFSELAGAKWHGLWGLLMLGIILGGQRGFQRQVILIPFFLLSYLAVIMVYYYINTYFKIDWWMQVTLNRILISLLPTAVFWVFYSLWNGNKEIANK